MYENCIYNVSKQLLIGEVESVTIFVQSIFDYTVSMSMHSE